jgi:hypothetical protein
MLLPLAFRLNFPALKRADGDVQLIQLIGVLAWNCFGYHE